VVRGCKGVDALNTLYWNAAFNEAETAFAIGEVPVGAVVVARDGTILSAAHNEVEALNDATAHAELLAIRRAMAQTGDKYLEGCSLYVTLEPCAMCAGAIAWARLEKVYFAAYDPKSGGVEHGARVFSQPSCHNQPEVYGGIQAERSTALLQRFFVEKRF